MSNFQGEHAGRCVGTGKRVYTSQWSVKEAIRKANVTGVRLQSYYACTACGHFHTTSKRRWGSANPARRAREVEARRHAALREAGIDPQTLEPLDD